MKRLSWPSWSWWRYAVLSIIAALGATLFLTHRLASLAPRLSHDEQTWVAASRHLERVVQNPLHLPLKVLEWAVLKIPAGTPIWMARLPSVLMALAALALALYILRRWYGRRSMVFGIALIITSAWFLHMARFAGPDIEYFTAILALLAVQSNLHDHEDSAGAWYEWLAVNSLLLFIPGLVWLVLVSAIWQGRIAWRTWGVQILWQRVVSAVVPLAALAILAVSFVRNHALVVTWLGLPNQLSFITLQSFPRHLLDSLLFAIWHGPHQPELWLGQLPILDRFVLVMLAVGLFFYARHWRAMRAQVLAGYLVMGVLLGSLGVVSASLVIPILYLIAVAGIAYVLHFWLRVFPRNPIARGVGIGLVAALVGLSCYYNLTQYFVAWPRNTETEQVYQSDK